MRKVKEEISLDEMKQIEKSLLMTFSRFCEENSLRYSLAYGTLLGAVRHNGFIPWDDDIDVMMPRPDFNRFLDIFENINDNKNVGIMAYQKNDQYFSPLAKLYDKKTIVLQKYGQVEKIKTGVYIDIFIVDGLPETDADQLRFYEQAQKLRGEWGYSVRKLFSRHQSKNIFRDILGSIYALPYRLKGYYYYRNKYDDFCQKFDYELSQYVGVVVYGEGLRKEVMLKSDFEDSSIVKFEGEKFRAVRNPDNYLTHMYGDYMQLPPLDKRVSKHPHKVYRLYEG